MFTLVLAGILGLAQAQNNSTPEHVKSATAVSRVLGDGRKVAAVIVEFDAPILHKSLTPEASGWRGRK